MEKMIGGNNDDGIRKEVEMGESLLNRRKYNRLVLLNNQWYVGVIKRGTKKCKIIPFLNRNALSIARIISEHVLMGSFIITDMWRLMAGLSQIWAF